jgi:hypothetical protein
MQCGVVVYVRETFLFTGERRYIFNKNNKYEKLYVLTLITTAGK